jgi:cobalt/nickel transport system permease protein
MSDILASIASMREFDELSRRGTVIHRLNSVANLLTMLSFLIVIASFGRYDLFRLFPLILYPVLVFIWSETPMRPILKRLLFVEPLIIGIGILNPLFDREMVLLGSLAVSRGWITFLAILLKGALTVTVALLLIATTGMNRLAAAMRTIRIPKLFVLVFFLTFRYIAVLGEELSRSLRAYKLRAPNQRGIRVNAWGSLIGQMLLRAFDRADRVYQAMTLRGFSGEYVVGSSQRFRFTDAAWMLVWLLFFLLCRIVDIPLAIGSLLIGVFS